jgi:hypothetical protein
LPTAAAEFDGCEVDFLGTLSGETLAGETLPGETLAASAAYR